MVGIEAGGRGNGLANTPHASPRTRVLPEAKPGVLQGTYTYVLQTEDGQISTTHSISAGLDYPPSGPSRWLADQLRAEYSASLTRRPRTPRACSPRRSIIPALESATPSPASSNAFRNSRPMIWSF